MGSLTLYLSPRQLHVLVELAHGLASPDLEDVSNVVPRRYAEKPMTGSDFTRIERELIHQTNPVQDLRTTVMVIMSILCFFLNHIYYSLMVVTMYTLGSAIRSRMVHGIRGRIRQ